MQFKVEQNLHLERRPNLTSFPFSSILEKWEVALVPSEVSPQCCTRGDPHLMKQYHMYFLITAPHPPRDLSICELASYSILLVHFKFCLQFSGLKFGLSELPKLSPEIQLCPFCTQIRECIGFKFLALLLLKCTLSEILYNSDNDIEDSVSCWLTKTLLTLITSPVLHDRNKQLC